MFKTKPGYFASSGNDFFKEETTRSTIGYPKEVKQLGETPLFGGLLVAQAWLQEILGARLPI